MTKKNFAASTTLAVGFTTFFTWSCTTTQAPVRKVAEPVPIKIVEATQTPSTDTLPITTSVHVKAAHEEVEKQLSKLRNEKYEESSDGPTIALKPTPIDKYTNHQSKNLTSTSKTASTSASAFISAHSAHEKIIGVEPAKALGWLKNGNTRFVKQRLRADGQSSADIKRLSTEQHPHTVVIACSDSRVPPEILFDQKLGELFVIRTAGESLDATGIGSVEYALSKLGTRHVLVLGHTHCDTVQAACNTLNSGVIESENLNTLIRTIHPRLSSLQGQTIFSKGYAKEAWMNARGAAVDLVNLSPLIHKLLESRKIAISTAVYDIETGMVDFNK